MSVRDLTNEQLLMVTAMDDARAELLRRLRAGEEAERERDRRDAVLSWLAENMPRALEACPYKLAVPEVPS